MTVPAPAGSEARTFASVFEALADTPADAAHLRLRADLMAAVGDRVAQWGVPQADAAARLGITRPRLNDLLRGKLGKFSLDALVTLATAAGLSVTLHIAA
ncbi:MAG: XRE family transcriptional regulator [Alphaproteobacteria bacterium]|nr:XRE family transcriptional regulator [Alphaproteobacteria bacterium]